MDFRVRVRISLLVLCSSLGADSDAQLQNVIAFVGDRYQLHCSYDSDSRRPVNITWSMWPVGGQRRIIIYSSSSVIGPDFQKAFEHQGSDTIIIWNVDASTAGVYTCEAGGRFSAQFIVVIGRPTCDISSNPDGKTGLSRLSCTMRYAANASYVVPSIYWIIFDSSESPTSSMDISTSANITTAISTLDVTTSGDNRCIKDYRCEAEIRLVYYLPRGFATGLQDIPRECSPNAPVCPKAPLGKSGEGGGEHRFQEPDENWDQKPRKPPTQEPIGSSAGRLSVQSSEIKIITKCLVGIVGLLLIGAGTGL